MKKSLLQLKTDFEVQKKRMRVEKQIIVSKT
jgi:hypothetical protein